MNKYNVGDVVKLRDDLENRKFYGGIIYNDEMDIMRNEPIEIKKVYNDVCYEVYDECHKDWILSDEMIQGLWEECKSSEQVSKSEGKLKLIDVLNMIARGELKEGTKVNLIADDYLTKLYYDGELIRFVASDNIYAFTPKDINDEDEYELIEPNDFGGADKTIEPSKIEELDKEEMLCLTQQCVIAVLTDKLNEVIRVINKE